MKSRRKKKRGGAETDKEALPPRTMAPSTPERAA